MQAVIPPFKLRIPAIQKLVHVINVTIPSESEARRVMNKVTLEDLEKLINYFENSDIFLIIDEAEIKQAKYFHILGGKVSSQ